MNLTLRDVAAALQVPESTVLRWVSDKNLPAQQVHVTYHFNRVQLLEWAAPVADELGVTPWLAIPERTAAERQIARHEEGWTMEDIFKEQIAASERISAG